MMLKKLLLSYFLLLPFFCMAQKETTQYFDSKWLISDKQHAMFYRVFTRVNKLYKVEDFKMDGRLILSGFADTIDSDISYNRQGKHTYFASTGQKIKEGNYRDGLHDGQWSYYRQPAERLDRTVSYINGAIAHATGYDSTGKITSEISYKDGKKDSVTTYKYHPNGKLRSVSTSVDQKIIKNSCYSITGEDTTCETKKSGEVYQFVEQMPAPPYDMIQYLSNNINYPEKAHKKGIQGRVAISFVVMEDGTIEDVAVAQPVSPDIDAEAVRVISTMPKWRPGRQNGKLVKVMYTQPINFKLN